MTNLDRQIAKQRGYDHISAQASGLSDKLVYFNSVEYNGYQFLSEDAAMAGYTREGPQYAPSQSIIETGIATLVEPDISYLLFQAETSLLRLLIHNIAARANTKNLMEARNLLNLNRVSNDVDIVWSCFEREWLFRSLIGMNENLRNVSLPSEMQELRLLLSDSADVPPNAFCGPPTTVQDESNGNSKGSLDCLFNKQTDGRDDLAHMTENHLDLYLQELCAILFWASSALTAKRIRQDIVKLSESESNISNSGILPLLKSNHGSNSNVTTAIKFVIDEGRDDVEAFVDQIKVTESQDLLSKFRQANTLWYSSANSLKQVTARLLDEGSTLGRLEGKMSLRTLTDLYAQVDSFMEQHEFGTQESQSSDLDYLFQSKEVDEPYDDAMDRMQKEFGDWYDDDYVWSPDHAQSAVLPSIPFHEYDNEDEEPIEYALKRIDLEWGQSD
jgi:hypothetical protein